VEERHPRKTGPMSMLHVFLSIGPPRLGGSDRTTSALLCGSSKRGISW
jgi:hypothetical protein